MFLICFISSCYKEEKQQIPGVYVGKERHVSRYNTGDNDTISDSTYNEEIRVEISEDKKWFIFTKNTYPEDPFEICANDLARSDCWKITPGWIPEKIYTVCINGDSLTATLKENNNWAGSDDHYYFRGQK